MGKPAVGARRGVYQRLDAQDDESLRAGSGGGEGRLRKEASSYRIGNGLRQHAPLGERPMGCASKVCCIARLESREPDYCCRVSLHDFGADRRAYR